MYLKEISASGFKSFADKITIKLDDKITCVVGPNGSGKSNIVDAVRWVLGEQSVKTLRGDGSMSDVIFSGSKSRKPLNVASITLVFDNTDQYLQIPYEEVSIKRRVYRSGENEYFLNGEKCRLKDILNLLMDSGIGRDSFNIISQGEVQRILSNSTSERRLIFEEAASVVKYKKRKEEALRKLERTHDNLDRIEDIIKELEVQVEPLKEQRQKALEYKENKEGLDKYEVALITYDIETINEKYQKNKDKMEQLNKEIASISTTNSTTDVKLTTLKEKANNLSHDLSKLNQALLKETTELEKIRYKKKLLQERSKYDASSDMVHENIRVLTEKKLKEENEILLLEKNIETLKEEYEVLLKTKRKKEEELNRISKSKEGNLREFNTKNKERYNLEVKIENTKERIDSGASYSYSVRSVLSNPKLRGIYDAIGNVVKTEEKYTKAIEVALLSSKQYIIVEDENAAKEAIYYLKNNNLGRATFFPLNRIKPKGIDPDTCMQLERETGYIDILSNLVEYDKKYRNIITNQLGNIIVCDTIDHANQISCKINSRYRIITLEGEIIHVGGSLSGGSLKLQTSTLSLKNDLRRYEEQLEETKAALEEIDANFKENEQQRKTKEEELYEIKTHEISYEEEIKNKLETLNVRNLEKDEVENELSNLLHVVDSSISKEEEELLKEYYDKEKKKDETKINIQSLQKKQDQINSEIEEIEAINKLSSSTLRKQEQELKDLEITVNRMDIRLDSLLSRLNEDYSLTYEKAKDLYQLDIDVEEARRKVTIYKSNIKKLGMVNLMAIEEYDRVNTRYEFLNTQKEDLLHAEDTLLEIIDQMDEVMKKDFKETFDRIEIEFKKVFKELFGGGEATLKLTDPTNLLETDIEIIASPPGKKLTTINLLSGGEKTLTAISLLFAILNVRTVPFCLFDEVEAALDEANVDRFGHYLDHYSGKTQFIIITHKKKTMEYADTLYGITMQESGVSKLVSVSLKDK